MKRTIEVFAIVAMFVVCAVPAWAQTTPTTQPTTGCTEEFKTATYKKYYDNRKDKQDIAFQAAEAWIATCPTDESPYAAAIKKFHAAYKAATGTDALKKQFEDAYTKKLYADQIRLGKELIVVEPDNSAVYIIMGLAGLGDAALLNQSSEFAKKAITMIDAGKPPAPLTTKDQALAYLNYAIGKSLLKSSPAEALPYLLKTAKLESEVKKNPQLFVEIAGAYGEGPIAKQSEEYKRVHTIETPESKVALENINQLIDRQIDALARAAALTTNPANKKAIMDLLTGLYNDRHKSEAGLNELIASIATKPIPDMPAPVTPPTPGATPTPIPSGTPTPGATPTPATTPTPVATPTPTTPPTAKPTPTPKPTPNPI